MHDPGGAKAIAPVAAELMRRGKLECVVYGSRFAKDWLSEMGVIALPLDGDIPTAAVAEAMTGAGVLLTGTSWNAPAEQLFRNEARAKGIPSVVVFDYWMNYALRFAGSSYPLSSATDRLCFSDAIMAAEAVAEGFPADRGLVTGHPHLDFLFRERSRFSGVPEFAAIFLSEDYPDAFLQRQPQHPLLTFAQAFSRWTQRRGSDPADFHVKLHPKEKETGLLAAALEAVRALPLLKVKIVDQSTSLVHLLHRYRYAFGYQTMALFEARMLGLEVLAMPLMKGDKYPSLILAMDNAGISHIGNSEEAVLGWLGNTHSAPPVTKNPFVGAVENVANEVERLALCR